VEYLIRHHEIDVVRSLQAVFGDKELLEMIVGLFPYPIQVFSPDGTSIMINKAAIEQLGINPQYHLGKYNVFQDPIVLSWGINESIKQVLEGETVYFHDLTASYPQMTKIRKTEVRDIQTFLMDITCFPLIGSDGNPACFAVLFFVKRVYRGKEEITKARIYMEEHWFEDFSLRKLAAAATLSPYYFSRLFKKHVGLTPHAYYMNIKIEKIKEKLGDNSLSISEVFAACGVNYHGHFARVFKEKVGLTPSQYRETLHSK